MPIKISDEALEEFTRLYERQIGVTLKGEAAAQLAEKLVLMVAAVSPNKT